MGMGRSMVAQSLICFCIVELFVLLHALFLLFAYASFSIRVFTRFTPRVPSLLSLSVAHFPVTSYAFGLLLLQFGQLGLGEVTTQPLPRLLDIPGKVIQVSCGAFHAAAVTGKTKTVTK